MFTEILKEHYDCTIVFTFSKHFSKDMYNFDGILKPNCRGKRDKDSKPKFHFSYRLHCL